jgi:membrane-bound lytic murein transglycosylase B
VDESIRITDDQKVKLLALDADEDSKQYFVVFNNFISITRYNTSPLYAMAVYDLSRAIADEFSNL